MRSTLIGCPICSSARDVGGDDVDVRHARRAAGLGLSHRYHQCQVSQGMPLHWGRRAVGPRHLPRVQLFGAQLVDTELTPAVHSLTWFAHQAHSRYPTECARRARRVWMPLEGVSTAMCVSAIADVGVFQLFVIVNGACFHKTSPAPCQTVQPPSSPTLPLLPGGPMPQRPCSANHSPPIATTRVPG